MAERKHNAKRPRLHFLSKIMKNEEGFVSTMTDSLNSLMGFWKLIGKMRKSQNFYKDSSKSYCIATYHTENFKRLRFYFKNLNPSSFQLSYLFHWLHRAKSIFIFPWKTCFYDNTKKPKQLKQQTIQNQKTRLMCETGNWSHPREKILGARMTRMALLAVPDNSICKWAYCVQSTGGVPRPTTRHVYVLNSSPGI